MFKHILAVWVAIIAIAAGVGFAVYNGQNTRAQTNQGLHTFICYFEDAVLKTPQTPAKRNYAIRFFDRVNYAINEPVCIR